jgi:hypothetical protein
MDKAFNAVAFVSVCNSLVFEGIPPTDTCGITNQVINAEDGIFADGKVIPEVATTPLPAALHSSPPASAA